VKHPVMDKKNDKEPIVDFENENMIPAPPRSDFFRPSSGQAVRFIRIHPVSEATQFSPGTGPFPRLRMRIKIQFDMFAAVVMKRLIEISTLRQTLLFPQAKHPLTQSLFKVGDTIRGSETQGFQKSSPSVHSFSLLRMVN